MNYIISYASGGLGNRLLPLASCIELSKSLGRNVGIVWNSTNRCEGEFNSLFDNKISFDLKSLLNVNPSEISIYTNESYLLHDYNLNKNPDLHDLYLKVGVTELNLINKIYNDNRKFIIIYDNNSFLGLSQIYQSLKTLTPTQFILNYINNFVLENNINKSVVGVHARGTDFIDESLDIYIDSVSKIISQNVNVKIFFCSDSFEWEQKIKEKFPNNIIIRKKLDFVKKINETSTWVNNVYTSEQSVIEGLIDIYLLSKTTFTTYNPRSTFAVCAKILSQ